MKLIKNSNPTDDILVTSDSTPEDITKQLLSKNTKSDRSINRRGTSIDPVEAMRMRERGIPLRIDEPEYATEELARSQTFGELFGKTLARMGSEVVLGGLEGVGYLFDLKGHADMLSGKEQEFGNWFSDAIREIKTDFEEETVPITLTQDAQQGWAPWDGTWWASNLPSVASSLSLLLPAMGASKAVGALGKGIRGLSKLSKTGKAVRSGHPLAEKVIADLGKKADDLYDVTSTAVFSRGMENMMEGVEVYESTYQGLIDRGYDEKTAKEIASDASASSYRANWINLAWDLGQMSILFKPFKAVGEVVKKSAKDNILDVLKQMGQEGLEESTQFVISEEAKRKGLEGEEMLNSGFYGRLTDEYLQDGELWTSAFFGALGGGVMQGFGIGRQAYVNKNRERKQESLTKQIEEERTKFLELITNQNEKTNAILSGNKYQKRSAAQNILLQSFTNSLTLTGNVDRVRDLYDNFLAQEDKEALAKAKEEGFISEEEFNELADYAEKSWQDLSKENLTDNQKMFMYGEMMERKKSEQKEKLIKEDRETIFQELLADETLDLTPAQLENKSKQMQLAMLTDITEGDFSTGRFKDISEQAKELLSKNHIQKAAKELAKKITLDEDLDTAVTPFDRAIDEIETAHVNNMIQKWVANDELTKLNKHPGYAEARYQKQIEQQKEQYRAEAEKSMANAKSLDEYGRAKDKLNRFGKGNKEGDKVSKRKASKQRENSSEVRISEKSTAPEIEEELTRRYFDADGNLIKPDLMYQEMFEMFGMTDLEEFAQTFVNNEDFRKEAMESFVSKTAPPDGTPQEDENDPDQDDGSEENPESVENPLLAQSSQYVFKKVEVDGKTKYYVERDSSGLPVPKEHRFPYMTEEEFDILNSGMVTTGMEVEFVIETNDEWNNSDDFKNMVKEGTSEMMYQRIKLQVKINGEYRTVGVLKGVYDTASLDAIANTNPKLYALRKALNEEYQNWKKKNPNEDVFRSESKTIVSNVLPGRLYKFNSQNTLGNVFNEDELDLAIGIDTGTFELLRAPNQPAGNVKPLYKSKSGAVYIILPSPTGQKIAYKLTSNKIKDVPEYQKAIQRTLSMPDKKAMYNTLRRFINYKGFKEDFNAFMAAHPKLTGEELYNAFITDKSINAMERLAQVDLYWLNEKARKIDGVPYKQWVADSGALTTDLRGLDTGTSHHSARIGFEMPSDIDVPLSGIEIKGAGKNVKYFGPKEVAEKIQEIVDESNGFKKPADSGVENHYVKISTNEPYLRSSNYLSKEPFPHDEARPSTAVYLGNGVDGMVRDILSNEITTVEQLQKKYSKYITKPEVAKPFFDSIVALKNEMEKRGETILASGIVVYGEDNNGQKIAGELDLLTVDREGKFRIYDMKTMGKNKFKTGTWNLAYDSELGRYVKPNPEKGLYSDKQKYERQQNTYRILLNNTFGIKAESINIIPIQISYREVYTTQEIEDGAEPKMSKISIIPSKGIENEIILDKVDKVENLELNDGSTQADTTTGETQTETEEVIEIVEKDGNVFISTENTFYEAFENPDGTFQVLSSLFNKVMYDDYVQDGNRYDLTKEQKASAEAAIYAYENTQDDVQRFNELTDDNPVEVTQEEIDWFTERFPDVPLHVLEDLKGVTANGQDAWGMFKSAAVYLRKHTQTGTVYHEAFHVVFNLFSTKEQQRELLKEAWDKWGKDSPFTKEQFEEKTEDVLEYLEEKMANAYQSYQVAESQGMDKPSLGKRILDFFKRLYYSIKAIFTDKRSMDEVFFRMRKNMIGKRRSNVVKPTRFNKMQTYTNDFEIRYNPEVRGQIMNIFGRLFIRALNQRHTGEITNADIAKSLNFKRQKNLSDAEKTLTPSQQRAVQLRNNLFFDERNPNSIISVIHKLARSQKEFKELLGFLRLKKNENGDFVPPEAYIEFLDSLRKYGIEAKYTTAQLQALESELSAVLEEGDVSEEETSENAWILDSVRQNPRDKISIKLKAFFAEVSKVYYDKNGNKQIKNSFGGYADSFDPGFIYTELQAIIHDSSDVEDMMDKLNKAIPNKPWLKANKGDAAGKYVIDMLNEDEQNGGDMKTLLFFQVAGLTANQPMMADLKNGTFYLANRQNMFNRLVKLWKEGIRVMPITKDDGTPNLKEAKKIADNKNKYTTPELLQFIGLNLDSQSLHALSKDADVRPMIERFIDTLASGVNPLESASTQGIVKEIVQLMEDKVDHHINPTYFTIDGKRAFLYNNSNFIARELDKYKREKKKSDEPLAQRIYGNTKVQYAYLTGSREGFNKSRFVDLSPVDLYRTFMTAFKNNDTQMAYMPVPILADAPHMAFISFPKYKYEDSGSFGNKQVTAMFTLYSDIIEAARLERERTANLPDNAKQRPPLFNFFTAEALKVGNEEMAYEQLYKEVGKINTALKTELEAGLDKKKMPSDKEIYHFVMHYMFSQQQFISLFEKDYRYFSGVTNFVKRNKQVYSPVRVVDANAKFGNFQVRSTFNAFNISPDGDYFFPPAKQSSFIDKDGNETEYGKKFKSILDRLKISDKPFKSNDTTDAQAWIDPFRAMEQQVSMARWDMDKQRAFKRITGGYKYKSMQDMARDYAHFNVTKPFIYTLLKDENGNEFPLQQKLSETMLIPHLHMHVPEKRRMLEAMGWSMNKDGTIELDVAGRSDNSGTYTYKNPKTEETVTIPYVDQFIADSAVKVGFKEGIMPIPTDAWGMQQETPIHTEGAEIYGRQIRKLIYANSTNKENIKKYLDLILKDYQKRWSKVSNKINDKDLRERLKQLAEVSGIDKDMMWAIDNLVLAHPAIGHKIIPMIISMVNNGLKKKKMKQGSALYNASGVNNSKDLKIVFNEDGTQIEYMEAIVPIYDEKLMFLWDYVDEQGMLPKEGTEKYKEMTSKIDPAILEGIFYRIPTEELYSMSNIKIVGLTPINEIVLPPEITTLAGLDFDIDKMYGLYRALKKDKKGNFITDDKGRITYDEKDIDNQILNTAFELLKAPETLKSQLDPGGFETIKDFSKWLYGDKKITKMPYDPTFTGMMHDNIQSARLLVGIFANSNSMTPLYQNFDGLAINSELHFMFKEKKIKLKEFGGDKRTDRKGDLISKNIAEFLAAALDDRNNPILGEMNVNSHTANMISSLLTLGLTIDDVLTFVNIPEVKDLIAMKKKQPFLSTEQILMSQIIYYNDMLPESEAFESNDKGFLQVPLKPIDLANDWYFKDGRKTLDSLSNEEVKKLSPDEIKNHIIFLNQLKHIAKYTESMAYIITDFKAGDGELGMLDDIEYRIGMREFRLYPPPKVKSPYDNLINARNFLESDEVVDNFLYKKGTVEAFYDILKVTKDVRRTPLYKQAVSDNLMEYLDFSRNSIKFSVKEFNTYLSSGLKGFHPDIVKEEVKKARFLLSDYKKNRKSDKYYYLISKMYLDENGDIKTAVTLDPVDKANIRHMWWDMLNNGTEQEQELARSLIYYALRESGMGFDPRGFFDLIPIKFFDPINFDFESNFERSSVHNQQKAQAFMKAFIAKHMNNGDVHRMWNKEQYFTKNFDLVTIDGKRRAKIKFKNESNKHLVKVKSVGDEVVFEAPRHLLIGRNNQKFTGQTIVTLLEFDNQTMEAIYTFTPSFDGKTSIYYDYNNDEGYSIDESEKPKTEEQVQKQALEDFQESGSSYSAQEAEEAFGLFNPEYTNETKADRKNAIAEGNVVETSFDEGSTYTGGENLDDIFGDDSTVDSKDVHGEKFTTDKLDYDEQGKIDELKDNGQIDENCN